MYISDIPLCFHTFTATYVDNTLIMACSKNRLTASNYLHKNLTSIATSIVQITFTSRNETCPTVKLNNSALPKV